LGTFATVNPFLFLVWWFTSNGGGAFPWFVIVLLAWGVGVVAHWIVGFRLVGTWRKGTRREMLLRLLNMVSESVQPSFGGVKAYLASIWPTLNALA
jgi:hypothetical protein